jgi:hypothetical protein
MSVSSKPNARVDVGYGDREYWAFTNEYGQLIRVEAKNITLQNSNTEHVLSSGRYYSDEAKVPGTESQELDEGHVIADSLGEYLMHITLHLKTAFSIGTAIKLIWKK